MTYQLKFMLFGLKNSGKTFQRTVVILVNETNVNFCIDDVVIH